jgi:hypothetical protein
MAAVLVIRSILTSLMQDKYVGSVSQPFSILQTQVPPESDKMDALTEICIEMRI